MDYGKLKGEAAKIVLKDANADAALTCMVNDGLNHGETHPLYGTMTNVMTDRVVTATSQKDGSAVVHVDYTSNLGMGRNQSFNIEDPRAAKCVEQVDQKIQRAKAPTPGR